MDRTLVICKPDAVRRGLVGEVIARLERKGLRLVAARLLLVDAELAKRLYEEHLGKPFFDDLVAFITSSPALAMVVVGPPEVWTVVRSLMGATDPAQAAPGSIRGDLASTTPDNLVHGSDGPQSAAREIALFFPELD
ncbi:MAG TPA: nucleoside-diphosphate kinase [Acidimicrobiales bacterium]|nr:nucleoside-diphosphate kinase [Acidimicrobiales bacterium]